MDTELKLDHEVIQIEDQRYLMQAMRPSRNFVLGIELSKIIGEPFAAAAQAGSGDEDDDDKAARAVSLAVKALVANVDPDRFLQIAQELMTSVEIQGKSKSMIDARVFEQHFYGRQGLMLKLLAKLLQFHFKDFFEALLDAVGGLMEKSAVKKKA